MASVKLTKEQIEEYKRSGGNHCPVCQSKDIEATEKPDADGPTAYARVICKACGLSWEDQWVFAGLNADSVDDNKPEPKAKE